MIPVGVYDDAELPFRLGSRAVVDFVKDFDEGARQLRRQLTATSTDEGRLREQRHRLADLERERRFAEVADHPRLDRAITEVERLQATVAEHQFGAGKHGRLRSQISMTTRAGACDGNRALDRALRDSAVETENMLVEKGSNCASAVALGEVAVRGVNRRRQERGLPGRLVSIYPVEGMFLREAPFYVVKAPWTDVNERRAAGMLGRYLAREITPEVAMAHDYRPGDRNPENGLRSTWRGGVRWAWTANARRRS